MTEESRGNAEFDRGQYPELAACKIMPGATEFSTEIEVADAENRGAPATVLTAAVLSLNVPSFVEPLPTELKKQFDNDLAAGLVACRITERLANDGLIKIELPGDDGVKEVLIPTSRLARPRT